MTLLSLRLITVCSFALIVLLAGCNEDGPLQELNRGIPTFAEVVSDTTGFGEAAAGEMLPVALRFTDPYGETVPDAEVVWRPTGEGASVEPDDTTRTNADGVTEAMWKLGESGSYRLTARATTASIELSAQVR